MRSASKPAILTALLMLTTICAHADDSPTNDDATIASARTALEEQRYEDARTAVHDLLASPRSAQRAPALEITAVAWLLQGEQNEATPYVHALYEIAPAFQMLDTSLPPRVTQPFEQEALRPHARAVAIAIHPAADGTSYVLQISQPAAHLSLSCRPSRSTVFSAVNLVSVAPLRDRFTLPTSGTYDCLATASDEENMPLGRLGTRTSPVELHLDPVIVRKSSGALSQWWFWTAVGAAVVGGTALVYAETRPRDVSLPAADIPDAKATSFRFP